MARHIRGKLTELLNGASVFVGIDPDDPADAYRYIAFRNPEGVETVKLPLPRPKSP